MLMMLAAWVFFCSVRPVDSHDAGGCVPKVHPADAHDAGCLVVLCPNYAQLMLMIQSSLS